MEEKNISKILNFRTFLTKMIINISKDYKFYNSSQKFRIFEPINIFKIEES